MGRIDYVLGQPSMMMPRIGFSGMATEDSRWCGKPARFRAESIPESDFRVSNGR